MRLINIRNRELEEHFGDRVPRYAILSHAWGDDEVSFQEWHDKEHRQAKEGFAKIDSACRQAARDGLEYLWCDTNCIDKSSSTELSEAINSMFAWYRDSAICYAYLADVASSGQPGEHYTLQFQHSRWFSRGWTLQELLAPARVHFYTRGWARLGTKGGIPGPISSITGIPVAYLTGQRAVAEASVAERMSWLSKRRTTRVEDLAYCMLGIFGLNMPLLYGEGRKAFLRLQEEIIRVSNDHTLFCWTWPSDDDDDHHHHGMPENWVSMLAPSPAAFARSGSYRQVRSADRELAPYSSTNAGLSIRLRPVGAAGYTFGVLDAQRVGVSGHVAVPLRRTARGGSWARLPFPRRPIPLPDSGPRRPEELFYVGPHRGLKSSMYWSYATHRRYGVLLTFDDRDAAAAAMLQHRCIQLNGVWDTSRSVFFLDPIEKQKASCGILSFALGWGDKGYRRLTMFFAITEPRPTEHLFFSQILPPTLFAQDEREWCGDEWYGPRDRIDQALHRLSRKALDLSAQAAEEVRRHENAVRKRLEEEEGDDNNNKDMFEPAKFGREFVELVKPWPMVVRPFHVSSRWLREPGLDALGSLPSSSSSSSSDGAGSPRAGFTTITVDVGT
ncbi:HET-domain-containing protein [Xylariomycetidae sp. FL2044]|nr:HET-domain-containing protein [Xylariomycetidae sp. FL2044]